MAASGVVRVTGVALLAISGSAGCGGRTAAPAVSAPRHRPVTVYVANAWSGTVTPILAGGGRPGQPIRVSPGPEQILIGPGGKTAFVAGHRYLPDRGTPTTLTAIRTATNVAAKTLRMCRAAPGDNLTMAITPDGSTLYYLCPSANRVIPVRTRTMTAGKPINAGPYPDAIAITPDGRTAYVANAGIRTVTPIRTATNTPGLPIKVGLGPQALAITPDGKTVYAVTPYQTTPISTATGKPGKPIKSAGGHAIAITPDGRTAYVVSTPVAESNSGAVIPIHVATNTAGKPIKVGVGPEQIAITPDGTTVYVVNSILPLPGTRALGSVTPIRVATGTTGKPIRVGRFPLGIAIHP